MYVQQAFAVTDADEVAAMIDAAAAGHLVTVDDAGLASSLLPWRYDRQRSVLRGHLARANGHHDRIGPAGRPALVIFAGAEGYVSPAWYATKARTGKVVPTWDDELVHVHGHATVVDDPTAVEAVVRDLSDHHESVRSRPWTVDDAPAGWVRTMLRAIVAVEVAVERVEAKRKLSQNRPVDDVAGVIAGLRTEAGPRGVALADAVERANPAAAIEVGVVDALDPGVVELVRQHLAFAAAVTPAGHVHALDTDRLADPAVTVFSARRGGSLVGVAALRELGPGDGELKSMHTAFAARGQGVGRALVTHVLAVAAGRGYRRVSLETGTTPAFAPARSLYRSLGFEPCAPFGSYTANPHSACMAIHLPR